MMKKHGLKIILLIVVLTLISLLLLCFVVFGRGGKQETEESESESVQEEREGLFLIMGHDTVEETMLLYSYETGLEYYYQYNFSTKFLNKYGDHQAAVRFTPGKVVALGERDEFGYLTTVQISDEVWEQEKIKRFSIDLEHGIFTIGNTNYSIRGKVHLFSNADTIELSDITDNDILTVVGQGNKVLSINVTTGHGTLAFSNTELFEGSLFKLNNDIFAEVTENMSMEVPEGIYMLTVANDGWGSSREITIVRGETTEIDLDSMKGEGKKKGLISFQIDVEDVKVYIDYQLVDHTEAVEVTYGTHTVEITASGYDSWKRYLVVNSEKATLVIQMTETDSKENEDETESETESEEEEKTSTEKET